MSDRGNVIKVHDTTGKELFETIKIIFGKLQYNLFDYHGLGYYNGANIMRFKYHVLI